MTRPRILIADDHDLVVEGLKRLLSSSFDVVGTVTDGQSLLKAVESLAPEIVLVDLTMPQLNGLDALERIRSQQPRIRLIVLTQQEDPDTAREAIRRGASGYVLKSSAPTELFEAIEAVRRGKAFVSAKIADAPSAVFASEAIRSRRRRGLTARQREVLQLLAEGKSMKEAAQLLNVTARTIAFHKYSMMEQLCLKTTAELIQHAVSMGLVTPPRPRT